MKKSFNVLRQKMSKNARKLALEKAHQMLEKMAQLLSTKQANISRIEKRTDMYVSTLRSYIEALGGKLNIIATFPEGEVYISQFTDI